MRMFAAVLAVVALGWAAMPAAAQDIIAHRGASGERPEHTLAAYDRAIDLGADWVEPDLVPTQDGVLVARHENEISETTDVAERPEFADRRTTKMIDGMAITGWFTEDFTLAELRTLRARERLPQLRRANAAFDGLYQVPTLAEIIALVRAREAELGRTIGIYPEIKHPAYFGSIGLDVAAILVSELHGAGYVSADDPVIIQCFEVDPLVRMAGMTRLRLVQLLAADGSPADLEYLTYREMASPGGLDAIAAYAHGIGPQISLVLNTDGTPTPLVAAAQGRGLLVHPWTLRAENIFLPAPLQRGDDPADHGDLAALWAMLSAAGVDGVFTDHVAEAAAARGEQTAAGI